MRFSNLHQHSVFSDGASTMEEVVQSAIRRNFVSIGFSDHSYTPCDTSYCMMPEQYDSYLAEIARLRTKYAGQIDVLAGLELDYYSEDDRSRYDYWIASVHYINIGEKCYAIDHSRQMQLDCINNECGGNRLDFCKRYYELVVRNVERSKADVVGHFDVISKFGVLDEEDPQYQKVAIEALDQVMKTTSLIEMNTGAISRGVKSVPYPHLFLLERIRQNGGSVILSADSHHAATIDCYFTECCDILRKLDYTHIVMRTAGGYQKVSL